MTLEILRHFLIESSNEKVPGLNNNVAGLKPNDDTYSFGIIKSGQVTQSSKDRTSHNDLTNEPIETDDVENESSPTILTMCVEENEFEEKCEIINKLNIDMLSDQLSGLLIQKLLLILKISYVYYNDSSLFGDSNCSKIKIYIAVLRKTL